MANIDITATAENIKAVAANVARGSNPAFSAADFLAVFPQFSAADPDVTLIPDELLELFIAMADASIKETRFRSQWKYATCLYVAHFATLFLQTQTGASNTAAQVVATAQAMFPRASKSVGDVSVSYDTAAINNDLPGWAAWKTTLYGQQLATIARIVGRGGMYVW